MQIEQNDKAVEKRLNREERGRILALFSILDKIDASDIIKITGLNKIRVSEVTNDLEIMSYLEKLTSNKLISKGNRQEYYILYPANIVITKQKMQRFLHSEQYEQDKAKIIELLAKGELTGVRK